MFCQHWPIFSNNEISYIYEYVFAYAYILLDWHLFVFLLRTSQAEWIYSKSHRPWILLPNKVRVLCINIDEYISSLLLGYFNKWANKKWHMDLITFHFASVSTFIPYLNFLLSFDSFILILFRGTYTRITRLPLQKICLQRRPKYQLSTIVHNVPSNIWFFFFSLLFGICEASPSSTSIYSISFFFSIKSRQRMTTTRT